MVLKCCNRSVCVQLLYENTTESSLFRDRLVKDTAILHISRIGIMGLTFIASVIVIRRLSITAYGILSLAQALFATLQTFNLLTPGSGAQTLLSMAHAAKNDSEILRILGHSLKM